MLTVKKKFDVNTNEYQMPKKCRESPGWVGLLAESSVRTFTGYGVGRVGIPLPNLLKIDLDLLDICKEYHGGRRTLEAVKAEVVAVAVEQWQWKMEGRTEDVQTSRAEVTSLDCWGELLCAGDKAGGARRPSGRSQPRPPASQQRGYPGNLPIGVLC